MAAVKLRESENDLKAKILQLAALTGWLVHHCRAARLANGEWRTPIEGNHGFVDLVLVRERVLFRELKSNTGTPSDEQRRWIATLREAGADVGIWRPVDWPTIEATLTDRGTV